MTTSLSRLMHQKHLDGLGLEGGAVVGYVADPGGSTVVTVRTPDGERHHLPSRDGRRHELPIAEEAPVAIMDV